MGGKSLQFLDISGARSLEDLKRLLQDNFETLKLLVDGLTGERLEDWTPVLRDGSVEMTGDLVVRGSVTMKPSTGNEYVSLRRGPDGTLEHKDSVDAAFTPVYDAEYKDVTNNRALDTVYKNKNKQRLCQITLKMYTS